ncbi:LacI family DNA-binding transcriptional regulator [Mycobacterium aquaticum]|uniref:LacI family transcriptional regulator n=1 Tax=Mycobacterium aquaticum TaxID=1927124 RepID=A0A1X0BA36_9MYCO|nr:LacI family DNA-binding transcriptional regulator [Mycobacterium aquaticum]ORA39170.1 LacI family transcriptional regulator [Mycobacterium aquaticum]
MATRNSTTGPTPGRVTISTVADAAGVSIATVSRVMSGSAAVKPELAARVQQAVAELSYRPSRAARGLALGSLRNIGVLLPDLTNAYFFDLVSQMHRGASEHGYRILIADSAGDPEQELNTALDLLEQVDGLVLLSSRIATAGLKQLARRQAPVVLVNRVELGVDLPMVAVDNFTPMMQLCTHLSQLGHRRAVYLSGSELAWQNRERWRAIQSLSMFGLETSYVSCDGTVEGAYASVPEALSHDPSVLICFNDLSAIGAISALRDHGVRVPEDMSVTGFDDNVLARHIAPKLTTVTNPKVDLGQAAWGLMQLMLAGETPSDSPPMLTAEVILRESTAPPR